MEEGLLPSQTTIHMQPTIQELPIGERGSFSRSFPSPGRHVFFCGAECFKFWVLVEVEWELCFPDISSRLFL
jgi:hypothetical protein